MAMPLRPISIFCVLASLLLSSNAQNCSKYCFPNHKVFSSCTDLPYLDAHLHWNYFPSTKLIEIAYRAGQASTGWIAWGINPTEIGMLGTQALISFYNSNGNLIAYTTALTSYNPSLSPGPLSFPVSNISAAYVKNEMMIFAVLGPWNGNTTVNHVWQAGTVSNGVPLMHSTYNSNLESYGTIDFLSE